MYVHNHNSLIAIVAIKSKTLNHKTSLIMVRLSPASTSVKFLGITLSYSRQYRPSSPPENEFYLHLDYGRSTSTLTRLYKSYIRSLFDYGTPSTCCCFSPCTTYMGGGTNTLQNASTFHSILHPQRQKTAARLPSTNP